MTINQVSIPFSKSIKLNTVQINVVAGTIVRAINKNCETLISDLIYNTVKHIQVFKKHL